MPEPVFGIIKSALGFRQFLLRGLNNVRGEWSLVTMAWNVKRMFALRRPEAALHPLCLAWHRSSPAQGCHRDAAPQTQSDKLLGLHAENSLAI